ncbi:hypothetical protein C8R47DRAFT_1079198 [Mycena vitilis]|nr:hypothetical protein C8R47DRAFT_1079198 [Mycena vitilis]
MVDKPEEVSKEPSIGEHESDRMDTDEPLAAVISDEEDGSKHEEAIPRQLFPLTGDSAAAIALPRHGTDIGPRAVHQRSLSLSSLSSLSFSDADFELVSLPRSSNGAPSPIFDSPYSASRPSSPYPHDCRSTRHSPRIRPLFLKGSNASLPSLQEATSEDEALDPLEEKCVSPFYSRIFADDKGRVATASANQSALITQSEVDEQVARIARPPSAPLYSNWPHTVEWTRQQAAFVRRARTLENADALTRLHQAVMWVAQHPEILDPVRMQANDYIDVDLEDQDGVNASANGCARFAERVQSIRDTLSAHSPDLVNTQRPPHNLTSVPVSSDGRRHRLFSCAALDQPFLYRWAIDILVRHHVDWIGTYTVLRSKISAFLRYLEDLFRRRGWTPDETLLHRPAPVPPPYLTPQEYSRLRLFKYTFALQGFPDVERAINDFLGYRFQKPPFAHRKLAIRGRAARK